MNASSRHAALAFCMLIGLAQVAVAAQAGGRNGFDLAGALVPPDEVLSGGPPRDGIPAIDEPVFVLAGEASFLADKAPVLGIYRDGIAKAYPIAILNWHEIVNDRFGDRAVTVSYCPLCGSGMAYLARAGDTGLTFGVSGLLYNSDMLLYDRQSESLWSQILAQAVTGPLKGTRLELVPLTHTTWIDWRTRHPRTLVLSRETGHVRDYGRNPYAGYEGEDTLMFPVKFRAFGYHPKERVLGVEIDGRYKAYPFVELGRTPGEIVDTVAGKSVVVRFDRTHQSGTVLDGSGQPLPATTLYWFAWYAFHPDTEIYEARP